ncbi:MULTISPECIES: hypothetical protein [Bradyrhizobium]|uniref:hypothetical protein n=1 Tax=Bradyrhizobium elkanii TaxID=29448 RepID=UPI001FD9DA4E|nr:hypothetical protein [Bradyrhizobium elkanii]
MDAASFVDLLDGERRVEEMLGFQDRHRTGTRKKHADAPDVPIGLFRGLLRRHHEILSSAGRGTNGSAQLSIATKLLTSGLATVQPYRAGQNCCSKSAKCRLV